MAEGTYEYECMRAELLGLEKPNEEEFEKARAERLKKEQEEQEAAEAVLLDEQEEGLKQVGGKMDELNSILSSTQQKLNRFKQTACGSFSSMFNRSSMDVTDNGGANAAAGSGAVNTSSATASRRNTTASAGSSEHDLAQENIENAANVDEVQPVIPTERIKAATLDLQKKMTSHLGKLDSLLNKAENAEVAMSEQTKQMRQMAK